MRKKLNPMLKTCRAYHPLGIPPVNDHNSAYIIRARSGRQLYLIVSNGEGWDHISVSIVDSHFPPSWEDMCEVKDIFFEPEECVIQYHPPHSIYINFDSGCLHLWRPQHEAIPMPPLKMV